MLLSFSTSFDSRDSSYPCPSQWTKIEWLLIRPKAMIWNFVLTVFGAMAKTLTMMMATGIGMTTTVMITGMVTWSMEQFDPNAVESFIMAGDGTKCCNKNKLQKKLNLAKPWQNHVIQQTHMCGRKPWAWWGRRSTRATWWWPCWTESHPPPGRLVGRLVD